MSQSSSHNSILLKKSNEQKFNSILTTFGKSQPNALRFSQLLYLLLDRCIFNNRLSFKKYVQLFQNALKVAPKSIQKKDSIQFQPQQQPSIHQISQNQKYLTREQLIHFIAQLGKYIYKQDKNYLQKIFKDILSQFLQADNHHQINSPRILVNDQTNKKLLVELSINTIVKFQKDLRYLFNYYLSQNFYSIKKQKRLLLTQKQINLQNKKLSAHSLIIFLKQTQICPHIIGIQHVQDIMKLIVPSTDNKQYQFYHKHCLTDMYSNIQITQDKWKHASDPGLLFFEFQLLLARIAWDSFPKDLDRKGIDNVLERFFGKTLGLRSSENPNAQIVVFKKHLGRLKQYIQRYQNTQQVLPPKSYSVKQSRDPRLLLAQKHHTEFDHMPGAIIDVVEILKILEKQLPKMPPLPVVKQQNPAPFKDQKIIIGQQPPPQQKQVEKGGKGDAKKQKDKEEIPARVFPWAPAPQYVKSSQDYFRQLATKLQYQTQPISSLERGTINRNPFPSLLSETLFPPEIPKEVQQLIIGARACLLDKNYYLALQNYNKAHTAWKQFHKKKSQDLPDNIQLYFDYTRGSICLTAGKDDHSLIYFFNCRKHIEGGKLGFVNPDRALPYFGIGQVLYEIGQYQFAARAFLKARQIRQLVLGVQHVQTAIIFNNLGACFFMLQRAIEALGYTQIAQAVFSAELGPYHQRTMTARSNLSKIKKGQFENIPEYRKLWEVYEADQFEGKKKKGGAKKKKK